MADRSIPEQFYSQVSESIKLVFDLTSRIDERVKMLMDQQKESEERIERLISLNNELISRVSVLESRDVSSIKNEVQLISQRLAVIESHETKHEIQVLDKKMQSIEVKMESLSLRTASSEGKWSKIIDFALKLGWAILAGYILYRLGFPEPL
jgi:acetolactate synthase small subunit